MLSQGKKSMAELLVLFMSVVTVICWGHGSAVAQQVDVVVHIDEFHVKASPGDPFLSPDPDVFVIISVGPTRYDPVYEKFSGWKRQKTKTVFGADIFTDAGMVCQTFVFKGIYLFNGKVQFGAEVWDEDVVCPNDDDPMGSTCGYGNVVLVDPGPQTISSPYTYVDATFSVTIKPHCEGDNKLDAVPRDRELPSKIERAKPIDTTIPLDVNEASVPASIMYVEDIPWNFTYLSSDPPASVSINSDGEEKRTVLTWTFSGADVYDRELTYHTVAPTQSELAFVGGYLVLPDGNTVCNFGSSVIQIPTEIPTTSEWGMIVMTLGLLTVGTVVIMRRRRVAA